MSFLLITSLFKDWNVLSSALIVNTFILFIYGLITQLQNTSTPKTILFNIGMLIGLSNFIYTFSFTFLLLAIIGLITYRAFKLHEYIILIVGYLLPYYCLFSYQYLSDSFDIHNFKLLVSMHLPKFANAKWVLVSVIIIGILSLLGLYMVQDQNRKMNIQVRKSWGLMFFYFCISLCIPFFSADFGYWVLCLIPASAFIGAAFLYLLHPQIKIALHWLVFALAIYISYFL
jgi:hypothetical protein